ncbi:hypothetical protein BCON_0940g00040 [Botryotinia convoluta]|uniref:Uncharacterized protein n=1 Tax=Botryotinia convoluta TaxID=54673 RepID=A0A4Z1H429_9HELO|nr:hypothetical protein BCON_0940g00040 [Botryotinia convoluta]
MQKPPIEQPASPVTLSRTARTLLDASYTRAQGEASLLQFRKKARKQTVEGIASSSWSAFNSAESPPDTEAATSSMTVTYNRFQI